MEIQELPEGINECTQVLLKGALLLSGDGLQGFWNRLFTAVFSGGTEVSMSDSGTWYPLGQNKGLQGSRFPAGPRPGLVSAQKALGLPAFQSTMHVGLEDTLYLLGATCPGCLCPHTRKPLYDHPCAPSVMPPPTPDSARVSQWENGT